MGKTKTQSVPQPQSSSSVLSDYESQLPGVYQTNANLLNQYAPGALGLTSQLAGIASQGMESGIPQDLRTQYQSNMLAMLGQNAGAGIGADYMSRGLMQQNEDWKRYYQGLGLNVSNSLPGLQSSLSSSYTPSQALGYATNSYNSYTNALANRGNQGGLGAGLGSALGMGVGALLALPTGGMSIPMGAMLGGVAGGSLGGGVGSMFPKY